MDIQPLPKNKIPELFQLYGAFDHQKDEHPSISVACDIVDSIRSNNGEIFVAIVKEDIAGTFAIYLCSNLTRSGKPFAVVENVISGAKFRRQGIGRAMMNHSVEYAKENGCDK